MLSTHKFTPIHRNFIILKSFLNNHFVWILSFVDTCLRFITNVIYFIDWNFFSRIMHLFPIVTIDKPALYLMEHNCKFVLGIASQQRIIVFINSTVCSLLITLSESTSQPIPKSRSKALVSSLSYLTMFLKMPLSFALANSCDEILFLLWALMSFFTFLLHERWKLIVNLTKVLPKKFLNELSSSSKIL